MKIISLSANIAGHACAISYCIKNYYYYNNNYPTNFFDFLEVSLLSIIQVLKTSNIVDDLKQNNTILLNIDNKNSVYFNKFDKMISHHDLQNIYDENNYNDLIKKYERRYYRFIDTIKDNDKIFFIRYGFEDYYNIINFMEEINKINSNTEIYFINVNFDETNTKIEYDIKNYFYINFYNYIDNNIIYNNDLYYKTMQFNWDIIFTIIKNLV